MTRRPSLEETDARPANSREAPPDTVGYWSRHDRWVALGREVAALRNRAKALGVPLHSLPGAASLVYAFRALGRKLDRSAR